MKKQFARAFFMSAFLIASVWSMFPTQAVAGPGDGRGRQYWECRWKIACDGSHEFPCSTGGSCGSIF
jgi:hypothetical protein